MTKPTKEQLLEFVKNNDIELDPIIDDESALRHFKRQRDQYKRERDELSEKLDKECNLSLNIEGQLHDAIKEKAELKEEVEKLRGLKDQLIFENRYLEEQVESLRNKYTNLTQHIRYKADNNPSVIRYKKLS